MSNNIYLFFGEEDLLIEEKINQLKKELPDSSFNIEQLDGSEPDPEKIIAALQTNPLLGGQKLVIIRDVDFKLNVWDEIVPSLKAISSATRVVFWASSVNRRTKLYKLIDQLGEVYEFKAFADWEGDQLVAWIKRRVKESGKEITEATALVLQEVCGNNLRKLSSEIEKLITYIGEKRQIEPKDVLTLASPGDVNAFALSNALVNKDLKSALGLFRSLYKNKADLFQLLGLLRTQYRTMLQIRSLPGKQYNARAAAANIGGNPYFVKKCMQQAVNFSQKELIGKLALLLETDLKLKSGEDQATAFELLLTSLCLPEVC